MTTMATDRDIDSLIQAGARLEGRVSQIEDPVATFCEVAADAINALKARVSRLERDIGIIHMDISTIEQRHLETLTKQPTISPNNPNSAQLTITQDLASQPHNQPLSEAPDSSHTKPSQNTSNPDPNPNTKHPTNPTVSFW